VGGVKAAVSEQQKKNWTGARSRQKGGRTDRSYRRKKFVRNPCMKSVKTHDRKEFEAKEKNWGRGKGERGRQPAVTSKKNRK